MTRVLRTQVDVVLSSGQTILNADDAQVADLARLSDGGVIFYTCDAQVYEAAQARLQVPTPAAEDEAAEDISFLHNARWVVAAQDEVRLLLPDGSTETIEQWQALCQHAATLGLQESQLLAAIASGWAMGVATELLAAGIHTFDPRLPAHAMMSC